MEWIKPTHGLERPLPTVKEQQVIFAGWFTGILRLLYDESGLCPRGPSKRLVDFCRVLIPK